MKKVVFVAAISALVGAAAAVAAYEIVSKYKTGRYCLLDLGNKEDGCSCCEGELIAVKEEDI